MILEVNSIQEEHLQTYSLFPAVINLETFGTLINQGMKLPKLLIREI